MRISILAAALTGSALMLAACSDGAETTEAEAGADTTATDATTPDAAAQAAATGLPAGTLDANDADAAALAGVEGMTPEIAQAVVDGRPYAGPAALAATLGESLNEEQVTAALQKVFVPVNLNSASREDIMLIPGMTDKMAHEFEEYRPYEDMAEFDREIGKYVDADEVARLRSYTTL